MDFIAFVMAYVVKNHFKVLHSGRHSGSGVSTVSLLTVLGMIPSRAFLCGVCMFSLCSRRFSPNARFPLQQNMQVSSMSSHPWQGPDSGSGVGPRALCCGCPLLLRNRLNAENTFHSTLYLWPTKDLSSITQAVMIWIKHKPPGSEQTRTSRWQHYYTHT